MSLLSLLLTLLVLCLVLWAAQRILAAFSIGDPARTIIWVVIVVLVVLWAVGRLGGGGVLVL